MKNGKRDQNARWNHTLAGFIVSICALWHVNGLPYLLLGQILIFSERADSAVFQYVHLLRIQYI